MGLFSGRTKDVPERGNSGQYLTAGDYKVRVANTFSKESVVNKGAIYAIVELEVLESENPHIPVGSSKSFSRNVAATGWAGQYNVRDLMEFIAAAMGEDDPHKVTDESLDAVFDANENLLEGKELYVRVGEERETKNGAKVCDYSWTLAE